VQLKGKILHLTEDSAEIRNQLDGGQLERKPDDYHFGVNTDAMISGSACTKGYTPEVLGPYFLENFQETVRESDVQSGGFQVIVGGDAYGTGSSREAAVVAHQGAGIELVVARSFQRIFQENMVYCGLPFSTDFSILDQLEAGDEISIESLIEVLPDFFRAVAERGGLLPYGTALLNGEVEPSYDTAVERRPLNVVEKIVSRHTWVGDGKPFGASVKPGMQVLCRAGFRGMHEYTAGMVMKIYEKEWGEVPVKNPDLVAAFEDHFVLLSHDAVQDSVQGARLAPAQKLAQEMVDVCERYGLRLHGPGRDLPGGVCHRIVVEDYALPGTIAVLTDSHTPTAGVLNTFAFGVGSTAMSFALRTGLIPVTVPKVVRVVVEGDAGGIVSPKDLILHLIGDPYFREEQWRSSATDTCVMQLGGSGLNQWNVDELSVLTNMSVEGGLMTGILEPCQPISDFLAVRRGVDVQDMLIYPDENAEYVRTIHVDLKNIPVTVATPGDSRNRSPLSDVGVVPIQNVVIASCTGGSFADLRAAAEVLNGRALAEGVRLTVTPSSTEVAIEAEEAGYLTVFKEAGGLVTPPGCGSCIGNGPGIPNPGETTASTTNRNFDRRMGAPGPVYLVSPAVAAASAVTGQLTDPRSLDN
jgi:3-isopropylmalate/(R)-2-methylmalate dehydratase large subunit